MATTKTATPVSCQFGILRKLSSGEGMRVPRQDGLLNMVPNSHGEGSRLGERQERAIKHLQWVKNLIEGCCLFYMSREEIVNTLSVQLKIDPGFIELVWQRLADDNPEFFRAYLQRLDAIKQIKMFNELLEIQVELMQQRCPTEVTSTTMSKRSCNPPMHQISAGPAFIPWNIRTDLPVACTNGAPSLHLSMQSAVDMSAAHAGRICVPQNMPAGQSFNNAGMVQGMNGGMIKSECGYANGSHFITCGADGNLPNRHPTIRNLSLGSVVPDPQPMDDTLVDAGNSFGILDHIPRNFNFLELPADFPNDFLATDLDFLDLHGGDEHQGDDKTLDTTAKGLSDENSGKGE